MNSFRCRLTDPAFEALYASAGDFDVVRFDLHDPEAVLELGFEEHPDAGFEQHFAVAFVNEQTSTHELDATATVPARVVGRGQRGSGEPLGGPRQLRGIEVARRPPQPAIESASGTDDAIRSRASWGAGERMRSASGEGAPTIVAMRRATASEVDVAITMAAITN